MKTKKVDLLKEGDILNKIGLKFIKKIETNKWKNDIVLVECPLCGKQYKIILRNIKENSVCSACNGARRKGEKPSPKKEKKIYHYGDIINESTGSIFLFYSNEKKTRGNVICGRCKRQYETSIENVEKGMICKQCGIEKAKEKNRKYNPGDIIKSKNDLLFYFAEEKEAKKYGIQNIRIGIFVLLNNKLEPISEPFESQLQHVILGHCTGERKISSGESIFKNLLDKNDIRYCREKTFSDLRSIKDRPLRFDFCIFLDNCEEEKSKKLLVEIDGQQHFSSVYTFGSNNSNYYKELKYNDNLKNIYVNNSNNLFLVRINYKEIKDFNEKSLIKILNKYNYNWTKGGE